MTARRVLSLLCLCACAALLTAGCGGDTLSFDPVASAATKTASSESSRVAFTATMDVNGVGGMAFSGAGVFDGRLRSGALNMRYQLPAAEQAQLGGVDPTMEMIMDGRDGLVMYMRSPLFARVAGDKWIKVDVAKEAHREGVDLQAVLNSTQADPSQTLAMLTASTDAHPIGYDRVRGVLTTHYAFNVDLARLAKQHKELRETFDNVRKLTGISSYPAEAWIDKAGRVRRLKIDMSYTTPTGGAFRMSMTEDLYAFGLKVDVRPPDASQVLDVSALADG
jgi:hypothetical protein